MATMTDAAAWPHVVIIGGGFAGLAAARALGHAPVRVTLLDRRNHHVFQPLLYQVATAALSPGDIAGPIRSILRRQRNTRVLLAEAAGIDVAARTITLADGEVLPYDYLILAAGGQTTYFGHEAWARTAPGLKTIEDALEIRRRVLSAYEAAEREPDPARRRALLTFVVVGGGPTGVELAGALAEIARYTLKGDFRSIDTKQARVVLLERGPRLLATYPASLSASAARQLARLGVEVRPGVLVTDVSPEGVTLGGGEVIPAATVLWAAGLAASSLTATLGAPLDQAGRVVVEPDLSLPGHPEVYVAGDAMAYLHQRAQPLPGVAPVAMQSGRTAARNILRQVRGQPTRRFHYVDKGNLAIIGRRAGVADFGWLRLSGLASWLLWLGVHLWYLIGFDNRLLVFTQWAWAYFTHQRGARLITGAPALPAPPAATGAARSAARPRPTDASAGGAQGEADSAG